MASLYPFRLRCLMGMTDAIKDISVADGYHHDLGDWTEHGVTMSRVFRGRDRYGDSDPLPLVSVLEHPRALDALLVGDGDPERIGDWDLLVQGFVKDDPENPTDPAHMLAADVVTRLAKEAKRKGSSPGASNIFGLGWQQPCVIKLIIGSTIVRPADGVNSTQAMFWLPVTLKLAEDIEKPFE